MRKLLSLLLVPLFSLVIFLSSHTPAYAAACSYTAPASIAPNSSIIVTVSGIEGNFYNVIIRHPNGNEVARGSGQISLGESTTTIRVTSPSAPLQNYQLEVQEAFGGGGGLCDNPAGPRLEVSTSASTVSNPNAPAELGSIVLVIRNIIKLLVPVAAIAFFIMMIIGGAQFIFSGGDPKAAAGARSTLTYAIIGIILVVVSWLILLLVQNVTGVNFTNVVFPTLP